jgi:HSP20 family protein
MNKKPSRVNPAHEVMTLRDAMNRLFEESFVQPFFERGEGISPAVDVCETPTSYIIEASLPGLKAEDLNITVEKSVLTISGELRKEEETTERNYHRIERRFGTFERSFTLPGNARFDEIKATLKNGVLSVEIPKAEQEKPRQINVKVEG